MKQNSDVILKTEDLCKFYGAGDNLVKAVDHINLQRKIKILNSTLGQFSGIYLCKGGVYSFTCQCYTFPALLTAVEGGIP